VPGGTGTGFPWGPAAALWQCPAGARLPRPPEPPLAGAAPLPDAVSPLRRGAMPPTDTPSPRQQRQRTATGKRHGPTGIAPGWGGGAPFAPCTAGLTHPSFCALHDEDAARLDAGVLQTGAPALPWGSCWQGLEPRQGGSGGVPCAAGG